MSAYNLTKATTWAATFFNFYSCRAGDAVTSLSELSSHRRNAMVSTFDMLLKEEHERKLESPELGYATTDQLLDELQARAEIGGYAKHRTVQK